MSQSPDVLGILRSEMAKMLTALKTDTPENFRRKANNFLLSRSNRKSSSTPSLPAASSRRAATRWKIVLRPLPASATVRRLSRQSFGGWGATQADVDAFPRADKNKQLVLTHKRIDQVSRHVRDVLARNRSTGRTQATPGPQGTTQSLLSELRDQDYEDSTELEVKPVDLFIQVPDGVSLCMEIKLGGDLDSSNAPAQIAKFLTICVLVDVTDVEGYFATIYNKNGEGNRFTGTVRSYLTDDMILAGSAFWRKILPPDISFEEFVRLYHQSLDDMGMNDAIRDLVNDTTLLTRTAKEQVASELVD